MSNKKHKGGQGQKAPYQTYNRRIVEDVREIVGEVSDYVKDLYLEGANQDEIKEKVAELKEEISGILNKERG